MHGQEDDFLQNGRIQKSEYIILYPAYACIRGDPIAQKYVSYHFLIEKIRICDAATRSTP